MITLEEGGVCGDANNVPGEGERNIKRMDDFQLPTHVQLCVTDEFFLHVTLTGSYPINSASYAM